MLKKRIIFALLWDDGSFCLSRNFRLQRVGNYAWLTRQYTFDDVARAIDELMILDVTRGPRQSNEFLRVVSSFAESMQVPLAVGGGLQTFVNADRALDAGADKVVFNSAVHSSPEVLAAVRDVFGQQSIIISLDVKRASGGYVVYSGDGRTRGPSLRDILVSPITERAGEVLVNSIDLDGTGNGLDLGILNFVSSDLELPLILMGGTGQPSHMVAGLLHSRVDAVCTSNLLNFIGDGLSQARAACIAADIPIPNRLSVLDLPEARFSGC